MARPVRLLSVVAVLAASASGMPCPASCPHQQQAAATSPWRLMLLPPRGIIVLVPWYIHMCLSQQFTAGVPALAAPVLQASVASTGKRGFGPATTEEAVGLPHWEDLLRNFISAPDRPCGFGQLGSVVGLCQELSSSPDGEQTLTARTG
ncbi:uncharacterized protein LOC124794681 isoform X1 [Schistocerca piceifrons]|uniref:uncharacterized protein LOC124794681 isoform X1 n=1 Tax=Schistocerca piceifrons TaxID=274613 RepID=UPI001F5F8DDD|nr:uncharacterized protein LOC124794681 isoform X1 [Schistocerca piceifrons]